MCPTNGASPGRQAPRALVLESWHRSRLALPSAEAAMPPQVWESHELHEIRRNHPLAAIMPVIHRLLIEPSRDTGLLIAVGDEHGRLLWVEGDSPARRLGEDINFAQGTDWSEASVGTSAPGTALVLGRGVQIAGEEHFNPSVHSWSCTAVPVHDPDTGGILGIVDITGGAQAVGANTLSLVLATVAASEAQLRIARLERLAQAPHRAHRASSASAVSGASGASGARTTGPAPAPRRPDTPRASTKALYRDSLHVLGRDQGLLHVAGATVTLSARHTEIMMMLALHPDGLTAQELAGRIYPDGAPAISLRAEMVRLRKVLAEVAPAWVPASRPYRLRQALVVDAEQLSNYLGRGAHRLALGIYKGAVLPQSEAPAVVRLRTRLALLLREAILSDASADVVLRYLLLPQAKDDVEAWQCALRLLPPRSPRRAAVVAALEALTG